MTDVTTRDECLRQMLSATPARDAGRVQSRIRHGCTARAIEVRDDVEHADADVRGDIDCALLQARAETLTRIDEALVRLDAGEYGSCSECAAEISEQRLRALPFAVRCKTCEERREQEQARARQLAQRRGSLSLFSDAVGS